MWLLLFQLDRLQNDLVLGECRPKYFVDRRCYSFIADMGVADVRPPINRFPLAHWCEEMECEQANALALPVFSRARDRVHTAEVNHDGAGKMQIEILPPVGVTLEVAVLLEEWIGRRVAYPAPRLDRISGSLTLHRDVRVIGAAQCRRMDEGDVGWVDEIFREIEIVLFDVKRVALVGVPFRLSQLG